MALFFQVFLVMAVAFSSMSCQESPAANQPKTKLIITGSSTLAPLVMEIGKRFEAQHSGMRIDVQTGGSSRGIADIRQGLADIGMVSRQLNEREQDLFGTVIAHDGIGLIVHQSNPVSALDEAQVIGIYRGEIINWKDVGGVEAPITVVHKADGRATLDVFLKHFNLSHSRVKAHAIIGDNEQGIKTVAGNPNAIAYVSIGIAEYDTAHQVPIKLLSLGEIPASIQTLQEGRFPLSRPLSLVTTTIPHGVISDFIHFAQSPKVYDLITNHYFVSASG